MYNDDQLQEPRPQVIKEELLKIGIYEGLTDSERKRLQSSNQIETRSDGNQISISIPAPEVNVLRLCFMNIRKIDNLQAYSNLKELYLANNLINKIENLSVLTSLTKLDLSFNQISDIETSTGTNTFEALKSLINLEELSLFKNQISKLDSFPDLPKLRYLSLGRNKIEELGEIQNLHKLKSLRILTIASNPITKKDICKLTVLAYLPGLRFLDYARATKSEITDAKERHSDHINTLQQGEEVKRMQAESDRVAQAREKTLRDSFLFKISTLHENIFKNDSDHSKIRSIGEIAEPYMRFGDDMKKTIDGFTTDILTQSRLLKEEEELFQKAYNNIIEQNRQEMIQIVKSLERKRRKFFETMNHEDEHMTDTINNNLEEYKNEIENTNEILMTTEFALVDSVAEMIRFYETELDERLTVINEKISLFFGTIRNLNNDYNEKVNEICLKLWERFNQGEAVEVNEEIRGILVDKDAMTSTIQASHEHRNTKIYKREENILNMYKQKVDQMISDVKQTDLERNRKRIQEIYVYISVLTKDNEHLNDADNDQN